jgi:hypothetical protein
VPEWEVDNSPSSTEEIKGSQVGTYGSWSDGLRGKFTFPIAYSQCSDGRLGFDPRQQQKIFIFSTVSKSVVGPTHPPIQWVSGAIFLEVKRQGGEANHSPPSSAEVKNGGAL